MESLRKLIIEPHSPEYIASQVIYIFPSIVEQLTHLYMANDDNGMIVTDGTNKLNDITFPNLLVYSGYIERLDISKTMPNLIELYPLDDIYDKTFPSGLEVLVYISRGFYRDRLTAIKLEKILQLQNLKVMSIGIKQEHLLSCIQKRPDIKYIAFGMYTIHTFNGDVLNCPKLMFHHEYANMNEITTEFGKFIVASNKNKLPLSLLTQPEIELPVDDNPMLSVNNRINQILMTYGWYDF